MDSTVRLADGSYDFSGGIDSGRVTTVQSPNNPNGLPRTFLAWLTNATVRQGGITQRTGWQPLVNLLLTGVLFQGGFLYEPAFANPYFILSIGGRIYQALAEAPYTVTDLSAVFGLTNPATVPLAFFVQGERFLVIQAGDLTTNPTPTLPLFWDGNTLRRSHGITGNTTGPNINELPAATAMCYYQGRIWYAQGRIYTAGDIVGGPSGTIPYQFKDSVLKVTENPLAIGGDGFTVPDNAGEIRALQYTANDNSILGQGPLYIFTRKQIYALTVPVTRTAWIAATSSNQPVQVVSQRKWGSVGDRCVVPVNGDLFYQTMEPAIRSLRISVRNDDQWGNVPLSRNENRVLAFNNRALLRPATGIQFNNRLWQAILPKETDVGTAFQAVVPLDFDVISQFGQEGRDNLPPAWEGMYEGLDILQLFEGDFGGLQRAFAVVRSRDDGSIQIWEMTTSTKTDNGDNRVTWYFETPAYTMNREFDLKELDGGEIYVDSISGTVVMKVEYRVDMDPCWQLWTQTQFCAARNQCEDPNDPFCSNYPQPTFCEGYKFPVTLPKPQPAVCESMNKRPTNRGFQFQVRVTLKGWCRVRGIAIYGLPVQRQPYEGVNC